MAKKKNKNPGKDTKAIDVENEEDQVIDLGDDSSLSAQNDEESIRAESLEASEVADQSESDLSFVDNEIDDEADEGMLDELAAEGAEGDDALAEFKDYDSLDEEYPEDELDAEEHSEALNGILTPKERRLMAMTLEARVESILFASQKPMKATEIHEILGDDTVAVEHIEQTLANLVEFYENRLGGFRLHYLKRLGFQFQTSDNAGAIMEKMFASRPRPISRAALETLAIIAYRQPVTRAEVEFIRGVDAGSIFKTLLERDLIKCTGRKEIVGRPMLFGTTDDFLKVFNLSSIKDLPPLEAFQPAREMVQGAMEKIADGPDDLVDIEQYIADNTGGDEPVVGDEIEASSDDEANSEETLEASAEENTTSADVAAESAEEPNLEDLLESVADELHGADKEKKPARSFGASRDPDPVDVEGVMTEELAEDTDGTDSDTEVAFSDGDSVPERSGDLDN